MQKNILTQILQFTSLATLVGFFLLTSALPAAAQATNFKCNDGSVYPAGASQSGVSPEEWCSSRGGLQTGGGRVLCNDGREVPLDAGVTPDEYCGPGGVRQGEYTGPSGGSSSSGSSDNCSTATGGDIANCGFNSQIINEPSVSTKESCGSGDGAVAIGFPIGCQGRGNAIIDMTLAILNFISAGVGIVVVASVIIAGIQYTASRGNPQAVQAAIKRAQTSVGALLFYIFAYAFLKWVLPGVVLN